ncbi:MAG: cbb3-type cytochrome c oxidase subunit I, partial [Proteobacteria bacterium]|nr:cbb3-type cytochrome c oxidase subunit I [Pseudomonadota bacterium]
MDSAILSLLGAFLLSIIGLFVFIWSLRKGLLVENPRAASAIFARGEIGHIDDPALGQAGQQRFQAAATEPGDSTHLPDEQEIDDRVAADRSSAFPVFMFISFACMWLLFGGIAGLTASLKLHWPDWLTSDAWMTFGRIRTVHLTAVLYGWITNAELGIIIWLMPRLLRRPLIGPMWIMLGGALVNVAIASGIGAIGAGWTDGLEYLEMPWQIGIFFAAGMVCIIGPVMYTLVNRKAESLYVTTWYHTAALLWITLLFIVGKMP